MACGLEAVGAACVAGVRKPFVRLAARRRVVRPSYRKQLAEFCCPQR